jgi:hypothetical protein
VQKRILPIAIIAISFISLIGWNCTKLDTTDIGGDQLPDVDNVNTFDTTLLINSTQENYFSDSTYIGKYDDYALGSITNDPLFGTTNASIFMQLKPPFYPFFFGNAGDTINGPGLGLDSIVLCLKYRGFWGDSTLPLNLQVREVQDPLFRDSVNKENKTNVSFTTGTSLGTASIDVRNLGNYIVYRNGRDSVNNQIRIKITNVAWVNALFGRDSTKLGAGNNNAFYNDSIYRRLYNGVAVFAAGGGSNGLLYANLSDTSTKLEVHYKRKSVGATKIDSIYTSLKLNPLFAPTTPNAPVSNTSNFIVRNRSGYRVTSPTAGEHFLQASPGTFVNLNIPGLSAFSNSIIHRAEIIVEQIPTDPVLDEKLSAPNFLYLELKDSGITNKWKPIYYDLNNTQSYDPDYKGSSYFLPLDPSTGSLNINYNYFGGYRRTKPDPFTGGQIKYYNFNVSRYVQQIVTDHTRSYDMRLSAPFNLNYQQYSAVILPYGNNIAYGRVRIGSGSNPNYKLRLRIIYSKL